MRCTGLIGLRLLRLGAGMVRRFQAHQEWRFWTQIFRGLQTHRSFV